MIRSNADTDPPRSLPWCELNWSSWANSATRCFVRTTELASSLTLKHKTLKMFLRRAVQTALRADDPLFSVSCIFTAWAYARAVLGVVILSVRLSVCLSHAWIVTKLNEALQIFWYHTNGQSLCYYDTNSGWWATPLPSEIYAQSDPPLRKNTDFDRFPLITSQP